MSNQPRDAKMTLYRGQNSLGPNGAKMDFRAKTALSYLQCGCKNINLALKLCIIGGTVEIFSHRLVLDLF